MTVDNETGEFEGSVTVTPGAVSLLASAEIDQQIATAHRYPRSIKQFRTRVMNMVIFY